LPTNFMPSHAFANGELECRDEKLAALPRDAAEVREHIRDYYAMISHLDHEIGRILDALDASGKADNTLVVLAGDNGLAVGRHGLMGKQNLYEHSVRVPLVMAGPGVPVGQTRDAMCYLIDVFPTLCDLLNLPTPGSVDGKSLTTVLNDANATVRDVLHFAYQRWQRAVTDGTHKLIAYHVNGQRRAQLFNVIDDPDEVNDLIDDPTHAQTVRELREQLQRWKSDYDDVSEQGRAFWGTG